MAGLAAVVLAGGAASRFPGKLCTRGLHGEPLALRVARLAASLGLRVYVSVSPRRGVPRCLAGLDVVYDEGSCRGPLAGIVAASRLADRLVVLSGDARYATREALSALLHVSEGFTATMLYWGRGLLDPLFSVIDSSVARRASRPCRLLEPRPTLLARLAPGSSSTPCIG